MKIIGVDPGTNSFDIYGLDNGHISIDITIPTKRVMESPKILLEAIQSQEKFDLLAAPSGFGLPFKRVQDLTERDLFEMVLKKPGSPETMGLQKILEYIKTTNWNTITIPGVKLLPTVPIHRKINKIDMGTADKVCAVAVGIRDLIETNNIPATETNFILVELGSGFSAIMVVENGQIIDGIGGSNLMGFQACGAIDGEIAYLMGPLSKKKIYQGGVSSIIGYEGLRPHEVALLTQRDQRAANAVNAFIENIVKGVYSVTSDFAPKTKIQNILLSGSVSRTEIFQNALIRSLSSIAPVRLVKSYGNISKEAAQGAAIIAEGYLGGKFKSIVETMRLKEAQGHILDEIYIPLEI